MDKNRLINVLDHYYNSSKLKEIERTGWHFYNVTNDKRIESIAEHIYGTQQLALAVYSEFDLDIDIFKVITMLSMHETEEIIMGDITPYDGYTENELSVMGKDSVDKVLNKLNKKSLYKNLIDEFEERKTPEAKLAFLCDKMEFNLQAKKYADTNRCTLDKVSPKVLEESKVKEILASGVDDIADMFIEANKYRYENDENFIELLEMLRSYKIKDSNK